MGGGAKVIDVFVVRVLGIRSIEFDGFLVKIRTLNISSRDGKEGALVGW